MTAQEKIDQAAQREAARGQSVALAIREATPRIAARLPTYLPAGTAERYAIQAASTVMQSPALRACTPASIVRAVLTAAEYGLSIDGVLGHAYLVPYRIRGVPTAQFQIGYRGLVELTLRTGHWSSIQAAVVSAADDFIYSLGTKTFIDHKPALSNRGGPPGVSEGGSRVAAWACAYPRDGGPPAAVILGEEEILEHRRASKAFANDPKGSPWAKWADAMWQKTAIRQLSKCAPMATEHHDRLRKAAIIDEALDRGEAVTVDAEVYDPNEPPPAEAVDMTTGEKA